MEMDGSVLPDMSAPRQIPLQVSISCHHATAGDARKPDTDDGGLAGTGWQAAAATPQVDHGVQFWLLGS